MYYLQDFNQPGINQFNLITTPGCNFIKSSVTQNNLCSIKDI